MQEYVRLIRLASTKKQQGLLPMSPATIWRKVRQGEFPKPIKLSDRVTAWSLQEVEAWLQAQNQGRGGAA